MQLDLLIRDGTLVNPEHGVTSAHIGIKSGKIVAILGDLTGVDAGKTFDASGKHVFPGVIDPHVHIGLAGGMADWETETRSAAVGGVTTLFTYLISGSSYHPVIKESMEVAETKAFVDYGFHLVPSAPVHLEELESYYQNYGIGSFKYFTSFRGEEGAYLGVQGTDDGFMFRYFQQVASQPGRVANVHPENIEVVWALRRQLQEAGRDDLRAWNESRPDFVEAQSANTTAFYAQVVGCPLYVVHISCRMIVDELRTARQRSDKTPIYIETCPHYLTHTSDDDIGPLGKVNPPLRTSEDNEGLWEAILDGTIDTIGSDHNSRKREKKQGSIWSSGAGFPGIATILPIMLSEGVHRRGLSLQRVAQLLSLNPARIFQCYPKKGTLSVGSDADLAIVDLDHEQVVTPELLQSSSDYSLYEGRRIKGWPVATFVRGELVADHGRITGQPGFGKYLRAA